MSKAAPEYEYTVERAQRGLEAALSPTAGDAPGLVRYWEEQVAKAKAREPAPNIEDAAKDAGIVLPRFD